MRDENSNGYNCSPNKNGQIYTYIAQNEKVQAEFDCIKNESTVLFEHNQNHLSSTPSSKNNDHDNNSKTNTVVARKDRGTTAVATQERLTSLHPRDTKNLIDGILPKHFKQMDIIAEKIINSTEMASSTGEIEMYVKYTGHCLDVFIFLWF